MKETTETGGAGRARGGQVRTTRRRGTRRELPPLDLRTPSGKRTLPY